MKRSAAVLVFSCLLAVAFLHEGRGQSNLVRQLAPGVYTRDAEPQKRIIANSSWVVFRDYVVVIDANFPWGARAILNDLRKSTDKPVRFVFDTHYHGDHAFGNSVWVDAGASIICSEDCAAESREKNTPSWANDKGAGEYSLKPYRLEQPQISFRHTLAIDDGARRMELLKVGPAHTRGDAVAYLPKERILFGGDVITNGGHFIGDADADLDHWVRVLDELAAKEPAIVVPGHGPVGTAATIRGDRAFLADLVAQVREGIAKGMTLEDLSNKVDLAKHKPWGEDANRNKGYVKILYAKFTAKK
jgi:glyoxylase-like metal-dependent hydrolase (beta-lactamase superfamily II)